jgi:hypothetical protein
MCEIRIVLDQADGRGDEKKGREQDGRFSAQGHDPYTGQKCQSRRSGE